VARLGYILKELGATWEQQILIKAYVEKGGVFVC